MGCVSSKRSNVGEKTSALGADGKLLKQTIEEALTSVPDTSQPADLQNEQVAALVKVALPRAASLPEKGHYNVLMAMGMQSFRSGTSTSKTADPNFEIENTFAVLRDQHVLNIVVNRSRSSAVTGVVSTPLAVTSLDLISLVQSRMDTPGPSPGPKPVSESRTDALAPASASTAAPGPISESLSLSRRSRSNYQRSAQYQSGATSPGRWKPLFDAWVPLYDSAEAASLKVEVLERSTGEAPAAWAGELPAGAVGMLRLQVMDSELAALEEQFWERLVRLVDWDDSGALNRDEFERLMLAIMKPTEQTPKVIDEVWKEASAGHENADVDDHRLAEVITRFRQDKCMTLLERCPLSGVLLHPTDHQANIIYMMHQYDLGMARDLQGSFRTVAQANRTWVMRVSEWATQPLAGNPLGLLQRNTYEPGLNVGRNASHIIVYNRRLQLLQEEIISPLVVLAMRNMYQSSMGSLMKKSGLFSYLKLFSEKEGQRMDSPESRSEIPKFLKAFSHQISVDEIAEDIDSFRTFNEFFYRKLKPGARTIDYASDPSVLVSAADCRLCAFDSVADSRKFWIKGRRFSTAGLLADKEVAADYEGASLVIFRLAPQDYHRFHSPLHGTIKSITEIPGALYTVNPIAVNSAMSNVFTDNKRVRVHIDSPEFGPVQFIAIGATLVGSIRFTVAVGQTVKKGDELGYFAFGGSTCITVFQKDRLELDDDIARMSKRSIETYIKMGNHIGKVHGSTADVEQAEIPTVVDHALSHPATQQRFLSMRKSRIVREVAPSSGSSEAPSVDGACEPVPPAAAPAADRGQAGVCDVGSEALADDIRAESRQPSDGERHWGLVRDSVIKDKMFLQGLKDDE